MFRKVEHKPILYVPGLGNDKLQQRQHRYVTWLNRRRPVHAHIQFFASNWDNTEETAQQKIARLQQTRATMPKNTIIFGISAGAGLSVAAFNVAKQAMHLVCGKITNPDGIGQHYRLHYPALYDTVVQSERNSTQTTSHVTCHSPWLDNVVPTDDMHLNGATIRRVPMIRHSLSILYVLMFRLPRL